MGLWTEKYKPKSLKEFVDQREALQQFLSWIRSWKRGERALLLHGPSGSGMTSLVHAYANEHGLDVVEMNASDMRSAKAVKEVLGRAATQRSLVRKGRVFLVDEIDGLSGEEDRGGVGELSRVIQRSYYPVILTANDPWDPRFKALRKLCTMVEFKPLPVKAIEKRLAQVCRAEGIKVKGEVLKRIAEASQGDLRAALNDLETVALGRKEVREEDLEALGHREHEVKLMELLRTIFKEKDFAKVRQAFRDASVDPDELFWWIEENVWREYEVEAIAKAFDLLSKADIARKRWRIRQMTDLMLSITMVKKEASRQFVPYHYPRKIIVLGRSKARRKKEAEVLKQLAQALHCSTRKVKSEYLPYLR